MLHRRKQNAALHIDCGSGSATVAKRPTAALTAW
jgi:hypothetical protein